MEKKYHAILNFPHPTSTQHPRMSPSDRAAQFSPFAALTGYDGAVKEAARLTERQIELSESEKTRLNAKLEILQANLGRPEITKFTYFVPDQKKRGGAYLSCSGTVKKLDCPHGFIVLTDHTTIEIKQILAIESKLFEKYDL